MSKEIQEESKILTVKLPKSGFMHELFCNDVYNLKPLHVRVTLRDDGSIKLFVVLNNKIELEENIYLSKNPENLKVV